MSDRDASAEAKLPWPFRHGDYGLRFRKFFPSTKPALNRAVRETMRFARRCNFSTAQRTDLEIALREALANAIIHGNDSEHRKRIFLRCYGNPRRQVMILVRDEGNGFNPESVPDPRAAERMHLDHGRGLLLMRELMDYVQYRKGGKEVLLFKTCPAD